MKIKTISRSSSTTSRECLGDLRPQHRNYDPQHHPHQRAREYTRAVTSVKLDRMFAKPFLGSFENGHRDGITSTCASRNALLPFVSGAADGELRIWDLATRRLVADIPGAHSRAVTGLVFANDGRLFYSCSDDGSIRSWNIETKNPQQSYNLSTSTSTSTSTSGTFKSLDHHRSDHQFASASDSSVDIWNPHRSSPVQSYTDLWGSDDTVCAVRYNPSERSLLAHTSMDRGVGLFDSRSGTALKKMILAMRSNCIEWNPMEPMNFVLGNEDHNAYSFDMRKLDKPTMIYKGHVGAILSIGWAPTGKEFVTGSYDKTIRIFPHREGRARDTYHTKRMQRVFTVNYSADNTYLVTGSDDTNLRLWKARSSQKIGQTSLREEQTMQYRQALIRKYEHLPEVRRIHKSRKLPKLIKKQTAVVQIQKESQQRKQANRAKYDKTGKDQFQSERKKAVVKEVE
mmetsp:Transcript_14702/g.20995  ORF Transcript_14702/g.20995 Transcript_14702/m.20995 type:complete len:456 (+) Transcript_14702:70-1437(+)